MIHRIVREAFFAAFVCGATVLFAGCVTVPEPDFRDLPPESAQIRGRAEALGAMWRKDAVRSVLLREQDLRYYRDDRQALMSRLRALSVNHAYLAAESMEILMDRSERADLTAMIQSMSKAGIACDIVLPQHLFLSRRAGSFLLRVWAAGESPLAEAVAAASSLKTFLPEDVPAPGVTVWAALHRMTKDNENLPPGAIYRWNEADYGPGSDNDRIMALFLADLAAWQKLAASRGVRFSVAFPAFYHEKARQGGLTKGLVTDFLAVADTVLVIGYGAKPSEYLRSLDGVLKDDAAGRIRCGMVLSGHMSESVGALRRRSWQDFFQILTVMHQRCEMRPGYGGMVLIPWQSVELLQER